MVLAIMAYTSWQSVSGVRAIEVVSTQKLRDDAIPGIVCVGRIAYLVASIRGDFWRLHGIIEDQAAYSELMKSLESHEAELQRSMEEYGNDIVNDEERKYYLTLKATLEKWLAGFHQAFERDKAKDHEGFTAIGVVNGKIYASELNPLLKTMLALNQTWIDQGIGETVKLIGEVEMSSKTGAGIAIGVGLTIAALLCFHILIPLARCRRAVDAMAQGRIGQDDATQGLLRRGDELGDIARSTHAMAGYLREMAGTAGAIASGNLTITVRPRGSDDALGTAFHGMHSSLTKDIGMLSASSKSLAASAQELTVTSTQMASSAEESSMQAAEVSSASEQVHQSITSVAGAIEEMDASIKGIAVNTQQMADQIGKAAKVADALAAASAEVGDIVKTVQSTADRTNLLALNATIEAASAGEAGRGFAVVANEVKELAKQSLAAAEQANRILTQMSTQSNEVNILTKTASQTVLTVASAVEEQSATVNDISRNMGEAARAAAQIASSINEIATAGRETASGVTQVKASADDLARQTSQIADMVGRFQLST
jgi:methyl-accepting chemotaxis protein